MTRLVTLTYLTNLKGIKGLVDTYKGVSCGPMKDKSWQLWAGLQWVRMSDKGSWGSYPIMNSSWSEKGLKGSVLICKLRFTRSQGRQTVFINAAFFCQFNPQVHSFSDPGGARDCFASPRTPCNKRELINEERPPLHVERELRGTIKPFLFHGWVYLIFFPIFLIQYFYPAYKRNIKGGRGSLLKFVRNTDLGFASWRDLGVNLLIWEERQERVRESSRYNFEVSIDVI